MKAKKVLFLANDAPFFISTYLAVARAVKKRGFEVHVAVPNVKKIEELLLNEGLTGHNITFIRGKSTLLGELKSFLSALSILRKIKPDIAHCITLKTVLYAGIITRLLGNIRPIHSLTGLGFIFTSHSFKVRIIRSIISPFLKFALSNLKAITIVQNPDDQNILIESSCVPSKQIVLIKGCGVNTDQFIPALSHNEGDPLVILTARMLYDKGIKEYVEAAEILKKQGHKLRMALVGPLDYKHPTAIPEKQINDWKRSGIVECWGFQDDILRVFQKADIACLPSYREGLPTCLIEAAACGLPIVTTNVPGCREVVKNGVNGLLVPAADAKALAKAIEELVLDKEKRKVFGKESRELAVNVFSEKQIILETMKVYDQQL